jgi:hypothetical protein
MWPILAADFTSRSKRSHASGANSISGFLGEGLGMEEAPVEVTEMAGALAKMVGAIILYYALLEHWIDGMVATIYMRVDLKREIRKHYPFNAAAESQYLRDSFEKLSVLKPFKADGIAFLDRLKPIAEFRHHIVHGGLKPPDWATETFEFSRVVPNAEKKPARQTITVVASELYHQGEDIRRLIEPARSLTHRLVEAFGTDHDFKKLAGSP